MEINQYIEMVRRWMWLLIMGLVLGIVGGYFTAALQTPVYQASTRVVVSRASMQTASGASSGSGNIYDYFLSDQVLIQTYVELLKAAPIYEQVSRIVNYPVSPGQVRAEQVNETRIISITVEDSNPQRAADIANAVVQALIAQNEELEAGRYKASDESLQAQISQVEEQIAKIQDDLENFSSASVEEQLAEVEKQMAPLQAEVSQLKQDIAILTPAWSAERKAKVAELQARLDQIEPLLELYQQMYTNLTVAKKSGMLESSANNPNAARLEKTLTLYQQIYLNLINTREAIRLTRLQNTQSVNQIEPAVPPEAPVRPRPLQNAVLGGALGLTLAGGAAFLIEYLDDTLKTSEDVERTLEAPVIGYINELEEEESDSSRLIGIYVFKQPRSPTAEAFRSLRTNLEFASVDKPLRSILVTSAETSDGKSTVATNLAAIFAQGGKRVILADCDLRRPRIHRFIGVQNRVGMTDLFRGSHTLDEVMHVWRDSGGAEISIITSGSLPPNPAELLGSQKMNRILEELTSRADVVILDSPPSMIADAQVLAAKVDGVALVVQPGKTHAGAASAIHQQLQRAGARIIGVALNRISRQRGYYGYKYHSQYYYQSDKYLREQSAHERGEAYDEPRPSLRRRIARWFKRKPLEPEEVESADSYDALRANVLNPAGWDSTAQEDQPPAENQAK